MNDYFLKADLNGDSSEKVNYDYPEIPIYIQKGMLSFYRGFTFDSHWHSDIEFVIALTGHMKYNVNGEIVTIEEGDGIFVNAGHLHFGFSDDNTDCTYLCLLVHPLLFCQNSYIERTFISPIVNNSSHPYLRLTKEDKNAESIIDNISFIFSRKQIGEADYYLEIQSNLFNIMFRLNEILKNSPEVSLPQHDFGRIKTMLDFISKHYNEKISLSEIAASANISKNTCSAIFNQFVSCTPFEYLIKYRIEKSMEILSSTDMTVTEAAYAVGFSSASYFTETFKNVIGTTPSEFKKLIAKRQ